MLVMGGNGTGRLCHSPRSPLHGLARPMRSCHTALVTNTKIGAPSVVLVLGACALSCACGTSAEPVPTAPIQDAAADIQDAATDLAVNDPYAHCGPARPAPVDGSGFSSSSPNDAGQMTCNSLTNGIASLDCDGTTCRCLFRSFSGSFPQTATSCKENPVELCASHCPGVDR